MRSWTYRAEMDSSYSTNIFYSTNSSEALSVATNFQSLTRVKGYGTMKLFKASRKQKGEVVAFLAPPATAMHSVRSDKTTSLEIKCKVGVLSKVRLKVCHFGYPC